MYVVEVEQLRVADSIYLSSLLARRRAAGIYALGTLSAAQRKEFFFRALRRAKINLGFDVSGGAGNLHLRSSVRIFYVFAETFSGTSNYVTFILGN